MSPIADADAIPAPRSDRRAAAPPRNAAELVYALASSKGGAFGAAVVVISVILIGAAWLLGQRVIVPVMEDKAKSDQSQAVAAQSLADAAAAVARAAESVRLTGVQQADTIKAARDLMDQVMRERFLRDVR